MNKKPTTPLLKNIAACFDWLDEDDLIPKEPLIEAPPSPVFTLDGRKIVSFSSNNYLGMSRRPEVINAARNALSKFTMGTCESRKLGGNIALLEALEARIASFKGEEAAMIFATGLLANVATIPGLIDAEWYCNKFYGKDWSKEPGTIFSDSLNHRSIQMGIKLSHANVVKYHHADMDHLEQELASCKSNNKLIVSDGVFSMDGDLAPLPELTTLANRYQATVMIDDAHGTGVFGENGRGVAEHFGVEKDISIHMGTLSKAVGAMGGFVATDRKVIDFLKSTASGYRFTSSLPAEQAAGIICAIDIMENEPQLRDKLWQNVTFLLNGLNDLDIPFNYQWSPIIPLHLGSAHKAYRAEKLLLDRAISCIAVVPPLVANNCSRLRITVNSTHTQEQIEQLLAGLIVAEREIGFSQPGNSQQTWEEFSKRSPSYITKT
ncbi:MAG: aminotransferase class I/II-fold pyridoxal phosphate-dependent enzyme [Magnetococcales bacterium]|nr:aminotransferase class I/II-fold pyridoxal phosphate-dependent enzyme [Magnetococcales bacterium]